MTYNLKKIIEEPIYKSEGERKISKFLKSSNIIFYYENPTLVKEDNKLRIFYPDFTLPEFGNVLIEYFGVRGDQDYINGTIRKKKIYSNGYDMIPVYPKTLKGNWKKYIVYSIDDILKRKYDYCRKMFKNCIA
jgi:hypothetical protein